MNETMLIVGHDDPVVVDFIAWASCHGGRRVQVLTPSGHDSLKDVSNGSEHASMVIFLKRRSDQFQQPLFDSVSKFASKHPIDCICIVSSFRIHFGDQPWAASETTALARLRSVARRTVVFRPGHVVSAHSRIARWLRGLWFLWPLVPRRFVSTCIESDELFGVIEREIQCHGPRWRTFTVLGPNRPWRELLRSRKSQRLIPRFLEWFAQLLAWLMLGQLAGLVFSAPARSFRALRPWNFDTLHPQSTQELLSLYNKYSYRDVKIVGYNNGVVHFGQSYPGKTIVSTVRCGKIARVNGRFARFDGGMTIRQANDVLHPAGKEFYVLPNYSYVALATAFFIPIHGSASDFSTMGETIERVLLYDPVEDRFIAARRSDPDFQERCYNLQRDTLLLRVVFRVKPKSQYFMTHAQLENLTSAQVLEFFQDREAANVEIRKPRSDSPVVDVRKFYTQAPERDAAALAFPRDSLGRLWDKLEANPISSVLFHAAVRLLGFHCELFFTAEEFATFWETHRAQPISKIQLRYIKRDGMPYSPFVAHDCISADMFMWRKHKPAFERYLKEKFHDVRFNPGKHSA